MPTLRTEPSAGGRPVGPGAGPQRGRRIRHADGGSVRRCGFVAIVGRSNVGKSTLLNRILGSRLSITSRKPHTTRFHLRGILNSHESQIVFVDTPGLQQRVRNLLDKRMNQEVDAALQGVDLAIHVVEACRWQAEDELVGRVLRDNRLDVVAGVNKIDRIGDKADLLPYFEQLQRAMAPAAIVPVSARSGEGIAALIEEVCARIPAGPAHFPVDQLTDRSERFLAAEIVREKLVRYLGDELPHCVGVLVDAFEHDAELLRIHTTIWVERPGQKAIVVGKSGRMIKQIGMRARRDLELIFQKQVHLQTWVRIKAEWTQSTKALDELDAHW